MRRVASTPNALGPVVETLRFRTLICDATGPSSPSPDPVASRPKLPAPVVITVPGVATVGVKLMHAAGVRLQSVR